MALIYSNTITPIRSVSDLDAARYVFGVDYSRLGSMIDIKEIISSMIADTKDKLDSSSQIPVTKVALEQYFSERPRYFYGKDGDPGPRGTQGIQGEIGDKGEFGDQGYAGETIRVDRQSRDYFTITKGAQGVQGLQGSSGAQGPQGLGGIALDHVFRDPERGPEILQTQVMKTTPNSLRYAHPGIFTEKCFKIAGELVVSGKIISDYIVYGS